MKNCTVRYRSSSPISGNARIFFRMLESSGEHGETLTLFAVIG
jgi:hypothetical protein